MTTRTLIRKPRQALRIDPNNPQAVGVCDGCGFWINHADLRKHMQYRGGSVPVWDGLLVCAVCDDVPNQAPQFRRQVLAPDPIPVLNPRVENATNSGFGYWVDDSGNYVTTLPGTDPWGNEFVQTIPDQGTVGNL